MDQPTLESCLADLHLPAVRYFQGIDSTNDEAWRWVNTSAPHLALVVADEQTAGRGRLQRRWYTARGAGLAFSLVLRLPALSSQLVSRLSGLGSVALCQALRSNFFLSAFVKWPNDVLINQRKLAGILVEAHWQAGLLEAAVVGIGINIAPESIEPINLPPAELNFPPICLEHALGHPVDRLELLHAILSEFIHWLPRLSSPAFIREWEQMLAYRDQWVELTDAGPGRSAQPSSSHSPVQAGKLVGLTPDGALKLLSPSGELLVARDGELQLRPANPPE